MKHLFFGGIHPKYNKELSTGVTDFRTLEPSVVVIPMLQHIGAPCTPLVAVGDRVLKGQKIGDGEGTDILAAFDGRVEEIGYNSVRGNYIQLSHGGGTKTLYLHCSEIIAPEGAVVRQGEVIARVGNTGWSTGAHLHFSISVGGKYCNPEWLINDV